MERLVECVPNFSEGRNKKTIDAIAHAISETSGVELLDIDPGADTNRTVMTLVGDPESVAVAAFRAIETASRLIDMSQHKGAHPRMGATDVCPFVPVRGVTLDDCAEIARKVGQKVGDELEIPVFLYEHAASRPERQNLATVREGEYENLAQKLENPDWKPDFGPARMNIRSGATIIGAREFLIAYNVNLNTRSKKLAHKVAVEIRERGKFMRDPNGQIILDENGQKKMQPGLLKATKAVGWYIDTYDRAQISINLTNYKTTPPHTAFETSQEIAQQIGLRVTGSELVGLIPLEAMLTAGRHFLKKQGMSTGIPEHQIINTAIQSLGLSELAPFDPQVKIIEYRVRDQSKRKLVQMTCKAFADELSTDSPAPGGGSVAALCGALGAALAAMVANLSVEKKGYETVKETMITVADKGQLLKDAFLLDVDRDTDAFNKLMSCFSLPKNTDEAINIRNEAIAQATRNATLVPFDVLNRTLEVLDLALVAATSGNQNSLSDSGVAVLTARTAAEGAFLNVMINLKSLDDKSFVADISSRAAEVRKSVLKKSDEILAEVHQRLGIVES